jgi:hypothetical protein
MWPADEYSISSLLREERTRQASPPRGQSADAFIDMADILYGRFLAQQKRDAKQA